jgi:WD40 repeat protein
MAQIKPTYDVFVSYSRRNKEFVRKLLDKLEVSEYDVWVDWTDIPPAVDWQKQIYEGIDASNNFIYIISVDSVNSENCEKEVVHAVESKKRLIPIFLQKPDKPPHEAIGKANWIYFDDDSKFEESFQNLQTAIHSDEDYIKLHTRFHVRSLEWKQANRPNSQLLVGNAIREAEAWLTGNIGKHPPQTHLQTEFIFASRRRQRQIQRFLSVGLLVGFLMMSLLSVVAVNQRNLAEENAQRSLALSITSNARYAFANQDSVLAVPLAMTGYELYNTRVTRLGLNEVLYDYNIVKVLRQHSEDVLASAVSPDGTRYISGSVDKTLVVSDASSGEVLQTLAGHDDAILAVAFSPDGRKAVSGSRDGVAIVWDVASGERLATLTDHSDSVTSVAFTADGALVATGSWDGSVILYNTETYALQQSLQRDPGDDVDSFAFIADDRQLVMGVSYRFRETFRSTLLVWDVASGRQIDELEEIHENPIEDIAFAPNGATFTSTSSDATVVWNAAKRTRRKILDINGVTSVRYSNDSQFLVTGVNDGRVIVWDFASGIAKNVLFGHRDGVTSAGFSTDGYQIVSGSLDDSLIVWETRPVGLLDNFTEHYTYLNAIDISPNGRWIASAGDDYNAVLWNPKTQEVRVYSGHENQVLAVAFSPNSNQILTGSVDTTMRLWDVNSDTFQVFDEPIKQTDEGNLNAIEAVALSPDMTLAVSGDDRGVVTIWDIATRTIQKRLTGHDAVVLSVAFSPDGSKIASSSQDATIIIWDVATGAQLHRLRGHRSFVESVQFNQDGTQLLSGAQDKLVILWDIATEKPIRTFSGHSDGVISVAFSPDETQILSGAYDKLLILWDVANGDIIRRFQWHSAEVTGVAFTPDGSRYVASSADGSVSLWQAFNEQSLDDWTCQNRYIYGLSNDEKALYNIQGVGQPCP